jgi:hypothetical protein
MKTIGSLLVLSLKPPVLSGFQSKPKAMNGSYK